MCIFLGKHPCCHCVAFFGLCQLGTASCQNATQIFPSTQHSHLDANSLHSAESSPAGLFLLLFLHLKLIPSASLWSFQAPVAYLASCALWWLQVRHPSPWSLGFYLCIWCPVFTFLAQGFCFPSARDPLGQCRLLDIWSPNDLSL